MGTLTGATLISAISILGKHKGVIRPVIASVLPSLSGNTILLDSGASLDVKPKVLFQYGIMGGKLQTKKKLVIKNFGQN